METLNMMSISIDMFSRMVREQLEDHDLTPIMGIGKSGVGKTESIYELTKELGIGFCEMRLVTMTEVDLLGIPTINEYGRTDWASNNLLPNVKRDGERGVLVLDEITSATPTIRAAAYQLLDSKRALGNYKLPDDWLVVALGNGPDDGGVFHGIEMAFINRCRCWRIEPDLDTWKRWAVANEVNPTVIAFVSSMPEYLHKFDPESIGQAFPSPRSWVSLSRKLNDRERRNDGRPLDQESVAAYTAASVGVEVANMFGAFYSFNNLIVSVDDIMAGKAEAHKGRMEPQVMYIIVQNLVKAIASEIKLGRTGKYSFKTESIAKVANACNWIIDTSKSSLDLAIMALTDLSQNVPGLHDMLMDNEEFDRRCPRLLEFAADNAIVFGGSAEVM